MAAFSSAEWRPWGSPRPPPHSSVCLWVGAQPWLCPQLLMGPGWELKRPKGGKTAPAAMDARGVAHPTAYPRPAAAPAPRRWPRAPTPAWAEPTWPQSRGIIPSPVSPGQRRGLLPRLGWWPEVATHSLLLLEVVGGERPAGASGAPRPLAKAPSCRRAAALLSHGIWKGGCAFREPRGWGGEGLVAMDAPERGQVSSASPRVPSPPGRVPSGSTGMAQQQEPAPR